MPVVTTLCANIVLGLLAALAAARELRASPRPPHHGRAFQALAAQQILIGLPIAAFVLVRFSDWAVSYVVDGARMPSAIVVAMILLHGGLAALAFAVGAHWLRDHRPGWVRMAAASVAAFVVVVALIARHRLGVVESYAQFRGGFGPSPTFRSSAIETSLGLLAIWLGSAAHLIWALARRL